LKKNPHPGARCKSLLHPFVNAHCRGEAGEPCCERGKICPARGAGFNRRRIQTVSLPPMIAAHREWRCRRGDAVGAMPDGSAAHGLKDPEFTWRTVRRRSREVVAGHASVTRRSIRCNARSLSPVSPVVKRPA
jgi:hypothetical protein